jgi:CheY-like chemotaxis protein
VAGVSGGQRVLVIDDFEAMRVLIHRALSASGYQVDVASTLTEAREMDPLGYDAVLIDANLGPEQGVDLLEALLMEDPAAAGRCLVMTGRAPDALPDGVACLVKPFQLDELINAVRALHQPNAVKAPDRDPPAGIAPDSGVQPPESVPPGRNRPAANEPEVWQLLRLVRLLRARERRELVDFLHDGPIQELTAVTLELQMMSRVVPSDPVARFESVLQRLEAAAGSLRWLVDGDWPFLEPRTQLADALQQRTAWLLASPVTVSAEVNAAGLAGTEIPVIVDVVELMLLGIVPADPPVRGHVTVRADEQLIQIELTITSATGDEQPVTDPASARAALEELASALGTTTDTSLSDQCWRAQIALRR